jgi:diadenosine tetraphosphate (Ap4A) HIT family hydrolase
MNKKDLKNLVEADSSSQTVFHAHIHLIPGRDGDTPANAKGG